MRIRYKPYARPELAAWPYSIDIPEKQRGKWKDVFPQPAQPLQVEMGCGKGGFLARLAQQNVGTNYLGIDIKPEMLVVAKRNIEALYAQHHQPINNVRIANVNVEQLEAVFSPEDVVDRIYINFCNPWYKSGHAKHRLTHPRQLVKYRQFLKEEGEIYFKTDDAPLFKDSLRYFDFAGFALVWACEDLHSEEPTWNIRTEHEQMFSQQGISIKACIVKKIPKKLDLKEISRLKSI